MKTVLFIDIHSQELEASYRSYDFILDEFCKDGVFSVCPWYTEGRSVAEAIPDLESALDGEEQWRAIVVSDMREKGLSPQEDCHFDNLFDFPENYDWQPSASGSESDRAIVRLSQMLGGIPEKTSVVWPGETDGHTLNLDAGYGVEYLHPDGRYDLLRRYRLGVSRPEQIICVTPYDSDIDFAHARRSEVMESRSNAPSSAYDFWQRNGYPANTRFVMVERRAKADGDLASEKRDAVAYLHDQKMKHGRDDWFVFWLSVLTLAVSSLDSSQLLAYRLHRMNLSIDEVELEAVFSRRFTEWSAVREGIAEQMAKEDRRMAIDEIGMRDLPDYSAAIPVEFELNAGHSLFADSSVIGLMRDVPRNDHAVWNERRRHILEAFTAFIRAPRRALYAAAYRFRTTPGIDPAELEACVLNDCQVSEIDDELFEMEFDLARNVGDLAFSFDTYRGRFEEQSAEIHDAIDKRSPKRQTYIAVGASVIALMIGFMPYCLGAFNGFGASLLALFVTLFSCLVLVVVALATLLHMRKDVRSAYHAFNDFIANIVDTMHAESARLSKRLSDFATFRKLYSIRSRQDKKDEPTARLKKLGRSDAHLRTRIEDIRKISPDCAIDSLLYGDLLRAGWESMADKLETKSFFSICPACNTYRSFNGGTAHESNVEVPYGFISNVELNAVDLC